MKVGPRAASTAVSRADRSAVRWDAPRAVWKAGPSGVLKAAKRACRWVVHLAALTADSRVASWDAGWVFQKAAKRVGPRVSLLAGPRADL